MGMAVLEISCEEVSQVVLINTTEGAKTMPCGGPPPKGMKQSL